MVSLKLHCFILIDDFCSNSGCSICINDIVTGVHYASLYGTYLIDKVYFMTTLKKETTVAC